MNKVIRFLRGIKSGSKQAAAYTLRVLHINLSSVHFSDADILPGGAIQIENAPGRAVSVP